MANSQQKSYFYESEPLSFEVLDIEKIKASGPDDSIRTWQLKATPEIQAVEILVAGGGMGGIAAALEASKTLSTIMTEETTWLGGQMTSQGVCALDENKYVESSGAAGSYLALRESIRQAYRDSGKLIDEAALDPLLHPGRSWVTRLSFEPLVALPVIDALLAPALAKGNLTIKKRYKAVAVARKNAIQAVLFVNLDDGAFLEVHPRIVIDATELGDLLALGNIPYKTGSDSRAETGESHAPLEGDSENVQDFVYPFVLEYHPGKSFVIDKPADYDQFAAEGKFSLYGYHVFEETDDMSTGKARHLLPFWTYRRLIDRELFKPGTYQSDVSMINWDANDLRGKNIIDQPVAVQREYMALAKRLSAGFLYWLQTEAPRDGSDSAKGYPEFKLVTNVLGTADGFSMHPYIREARRLQARTMVVEQDIVESCNTGARARLFDDSVGIGLYPVDIHGMQEVSGAAQEARPFQIPMAALVTAHCSNYIAGCKNLGVSHITNGAYRLHPIEWAIGTAAGTLSRVALQRTAEYLPEHAMVTAKDILRLQIALTAADCRSPVFWFSDVLPSDQYFQAIQIMAVTGIIECDSSTLEFQPDEVVSAREIDIAIGRLSKLCHDLKSDFNLMIKAGGQLSRAELADMLYKSLKMVLALT
jgi:hypothetical protein